MSKESADINVHEEHNLKSVKSNKSPQLHSVLSSGLKSIKSHALNTDLDAQKSQIRDVHSHTAIDTRAAIKNNLDDDDLLALIGYKEELNRQFGPLNMVGVAFSIMSILPSIFSVYSEVISVNSAGVWGWFVSSGLIFCIGLCMAEAASAIPTSGGLYYWTYHYAPEKLKIPFSYLVGNTNSLALCAALCSVDYGFAKEMLATIYIACDGDFEYVDNNYVTYGIYAACVVSHVATACVASYGIAKVQSFAVFYNVGLSLLFIIAMLVGTKEKNSASYVFGTVENYTDWTTGWAWVYNGFMPAIWTIGAFDSCVHMSEEAHNATRNVPIGILGSISACWVLGFVIILVSSFCIKNGDMEALINAASGQPMAQLIQDSLGKKWAVAMLSLILVGQYIMGSSIIIAISRQIWAFSRDNGLPFSSWIKVVDKRLKVPLRATVFGGCVSLILGLLCLIGTAAANALFTLYIAGNYFAWQSPIIMRLYRSFSKDPNLRFKPGAFYMGDLMSPIINWLTVCFTNFTIIMAMFPTTKAVDKDTMNYTVVITCGVWILSMTYYYVFAKRHYYGPRTTLDNDAAISIEGENFDKIDNVINESSDNEKKV